MPRDLTDVRRFVLTAWYRGSARQGLTLAFVPAIGHRRRRRSTVSLALARTRVRDTEETVSGVEWRAGRERESGGCVGGRRGEGCCWLSRGTTRVPRTVVFGVLLRNVHSYDRQLRNVLRNVSLARPVHPDSLRTSFARIAKAQTRAVGIANESFRGHLPRATMRHWPWHSTTGGSAREKDRVSTWLYWSRWSWSWSVTREGDDRLHLWEKVPGLKCSLNLICNRWI